QYDEFTVREALFNGRLPEYLASRAQRAIHAPEQGEDLANTKRWNHLAQLIWTWRLSSGQSQGQERPTLCDGAWPMFQIAQHLGWCGSQVSQLSYDQIGAIFSALDELDEDRQGYIWLKAYEKHYRDNILKALAQNHGRGAWTDRQSAPAAQLIFCMDDREEGIRRHLEEIYPEVETLGAAAHFNVPHNWQGLDDTTAAPLAPVIPAPVIPVHQVCEQPADELATLGAQHRKRHTLLSQGHQRLLQMTRQGIIVPGLLSALAAPLTLPVLIGKILTPGLFGRVQQKLKASFEKDLQTRIDFTAANESPEATLQAPRLGFTDVEQADRVQTLLKATGLTSGFSPLVMILGHGSRNQNNPHTSAYNCGACSGRFSGPNARLVAAMANR
ncbi:MAG: putative inorganic carbon transporter subunit DabA, partial [Candidatus Thiodiazotropha taylori]